MEYPDKVMETGVQLFSRLKPDNRQVLDGINPKIFPEGGPYVDQVIEVCFNQDVDYTDFFIDFIVRALLPQALDNSYKESQVILLHTDFQINLFKVIKFIEKKLEHSKVSVSSKKSTVEDCLKRLVILNCYTTEQLEITFYNLERIITNCAKPSLVVLDNCLSQYWTAKFENPMLSFDKHCTKTIDLLYERIKDLNLVLMYGRPFSNSGDVIKPGAQATYSICIVKNNTSNYEAQVNNLEKNVTYKVPFSVNIDLRFG